MTQGSDHPAPPNDHDPHIDHILAAELATAVAAELVTLRRRLSADGTIGAPLGDAGDMAAHNLIMKFLAQRAPADAVLSEEGTDNTTRITSPRVWVVDPLDGTREFSDPTRHDWAVHIALVTGGQPHAAAVALPATDELFTTYPSPDPPPAPSATDRSRRPLRMVVSRSRPPDIALGVANQLGAELVPLGSAGAKAMAVVRGDADVYLHAGGQYEWDSCAPVGVARAAGLHTSRVDGSPLVYNQPSPWLPDLLVCRVELAGLVLDAARHHL